MNTRWKWCCYCRQWVQLSASSTIDRCSRCWHDITLDEPPTTTPAAWQAVFFIAERK